MDIISGSKKDIAVLYNLKKRKRRTYSTGSTSSNVRKERTRKMQALLQSQYQELSQSQSMDFTQVQFSITLIGFVYQIVNRRV